jgi:hypothetical protein
MPEQATVQMCEKSTDLVGAGVRRVWAWFNSSIRIQGRHATGTAAVQGGGSTQAQRLACVMCLCHRQQSLLGCVGRIMCQLSGCIADSSSTVSKQGQETVKVVSEQRGICVCVCLGV